MLCARRLRRGRLFKKTRWRPPRNPGTSGPAFLQRSSPPAQHSGAAPGAQSRVLEAIEADWKTRPRRRFPAGSGATTKRASDRVTGLVARAKTISLRRLSNDSTSWCGRRGSNPHGFWPRDFKSLASTGFATSACAAIHVTAAAPTQSRAAGRRLTPRPWRSAAGRRGPCPKGNRSRCPVTLR